MQCRNDTSQDQQEELACLAKHQPKHTTVIVIESEMNNKNKKPVLIVATVTPAIDWLKASVAVIWTGIQSQRSWIKIRKWNCSKTRNFYNGTTKNTGTKIAENDKLNNPWSL